MEFNYQPDPALPVEAFWTGRLESARYPRLPQSPSVHRPGARGRLVELEEVGGDGSASSAELTFDPYSLTGLTEGRYYLLGVAGDRCLGLLPLDAEGRVLLPGEPPIPAAQFGRHWRGHPFPGVESGEPELVGGNEAMAKELERFYNRPEGED